MASKTPHEYVCINQDDSKFLDEHHLEDLLDTKGRKNAPLRTENLRKSIEHHLERQRLKKNIADFDLGDADDEDIYDQH